MPDHPCLSHLSNLSSAGNGAGQDKLDKTRHNKAKHSKFDFANHSRAFLEQLTADNSARRQRKIWQDHRGTGWSSELCKRIRSLFKPQLNENQRISYETTVSDQEHRFLD
ncbi:hypothetical protein K435DRAFT_877467 [Dendrothele bispora CBS 962.96]|uniref:Uncharacterized protein n=1 Tax=Dendrothele bispora (strain CBS 962.96) TaxID=1314807 RepID=A0A4S8KPV3_DENBC|nr:hypothetical protein K435DRAFT_877467 [Dendrothele bispora CBS 962.96]